MRIGFDAKRAFSNHSGLGNYSRDIIRNITDLYPENELFLFTNNHENKLLETKYHNNIIAPQGLYKSFSGYWRSANLSKDINNANLDIYHGLSNELPLDIKNAKVKSIVTIHDLIFLKYPNLYNPIDRKIYNFKFKFACKNADIIIAISQQTKRDLVDFYNIPKEKIHVIYQGCNTRYYNKPKKEDLENFALKYNLPKKFLLSIGTIEQRKNFLNVVKAIYYYNLDIRYVIAGKKTKYQDEITAFAKEHKIQDRIIILNNLLNEEIHYLYHLGEIFIYPSIYEGFGIPVIEAQNSGIPVITSELGSTSEAAGEAALFVNPLNSKSIGIAIKTLLENQHIRQNILDYAENNIKRFRHETIIKQYIKIYKSLIN